VITNDASEQIIKSYPVVFFCGDVPIDSAFAEKLVAYVAEGGTLVINWKQIEDYCQLFPDDFLGASVEPERRKAISSYSNLSGKVLHERIDFSYNAVTLPAKSEAAIFTADSRRDPLVVVSPYGKGKVVLSLPDFLKERYSSGTMLNIFSDLLLHLSRSSLPLSVEGDVQFQVNRNSRGWVVALYNNYGMAAGRDWQNPMPAPDPKEDVMVTIKPKQPFSSAREWFTCTQGLTLNVPAGEVRIVEIID